ncbi:pilus assembly protein TadG-related protein [Demequina muriae]|uniref:Pilus assembly protein TadG-related protein n=1 Tax=Demequina muriae TaxID=3051664 RepID=A0ABT8GEN7_9MICO|nr:pilus assembly protein TadG-related protein [Demequina sp. EGI L300058]MDN4479898.1 pilus assembly protein TadG-related protein [Demequina sp. EGI L300058]
MRDDDGNITLLTLGWVVLTLLALLVMAAATQVHLDRMRLTSLADELALAAADELDAGEYYSAGGDTVTLDDTVALDDDAMAGAVAAWLAADAREWAGEVAVVQVTAAPDGTATVTIARRVLPLFDIDALASFSDGITLTAEGRARAG